MQPRPNPPTRSTATDGKWEDDDFRARDATILVEIGSKPMVIENGIKSPSLRMGRGLAQLHLSPPVRGGPELMRRFAKRFRSGLNVAGPSAPLLCRIKS